MKCFLVQAASFSSHSLRYVTPSVPQTSSLANCDNIVASFLFCFVLFCFFKLILLIDDRSERARHDLPGNSPEGRRTGPVRRRRVRRWRRNRTASCRIHLTESEKKQHRFGQLASLFVCVCVCVCVLSRARCSKIDTCMIRIVNKVCAAGGWRKTNKQTNKQERERERERRRRLVVERAPINRRTGWCRAAVDKSTDQSMAVVCRRRSPSAMQMERRPLK